MAFRKIPNSGILHEFFGTVRSLQEIERELKDIDRQTEAVLQDIRLRGIAEVEQLISINVPEIINLR